MFTMKAESESKKKIPVKKDKKTRYNKLQYLPIFMIISCNKKNPCLFSKHIRQKIINPTNPNILGPTQHF